MRAVILTVDQRGSQSSPDLVSEAAATYAAGAVLPFDRTAGDEMQALYDRPRSGRRHRGAPAARGRLAHRTRHRRGREPAPRPRPGRPRAGVRAGPRGGHPGQDLAVPPRRGWPRLPCRVRLETVLWLWAGGAVPPHRQGLGGRRPGGRGPHPPAGRRPARDHPVGGQPARPGGRARRGRRARDPGHRAAHRTPRRRTDATLVVPRGARRPPSRSPSSAGGCPPDGQLLVAGAAGAAARRGRRPGARRAPRGRLRQRRPGPRRRAGRARRRTWSPRRSSGSSTARPATRRGRCAGPATCCAAAPGSAHSSGAQSSSPWWPAGPRAWR